MEQNPTKTAPAEEISQIAEPAQPVIEQEPENQPMEPEGAPDGAAQDEAPAIALPPIAPVEVDAPDEPAEAAPALPGAIGPSAPDQGA